MPLSMPFRVEPPRVLVSSLDPIHSLGEEMQSWLNTPPTSAVWLTTNLAILIPFYFAKGGIATKLWTLNGAAASGNVDIGLYDANYVRMVSKGSTAQAGTNVVQEFDITDTVIRPSTMVFLGVAMDNITGTMFRNNLTVTDQARTLGMYQMASAFPLPDPFVPAAPGNVKVPVCGIAFRTLVG